MSNILYLLIFFCILKIIVNILIFRLSEDDCHLTYIQIINKKNNKIIMEFNDSIENHSDIINDIANNENIIISFSERRNKKIDRIRFVDNMTQHILLSIPVYLILFSLLFIFDYYFISSTLTFITIQSISNISFILSFATVPIFKLLLRILIYQNMLQKTYNNGLTLQDVIEFQNRIYDIRINNIKNKKE